MVFLKLAALHSFPCSVKDAVLQQVERLRLHLRYIRDHCVGTGAFPLQYLVLVDLDGVSIQNCVGPSPFLLFNRTSIRKKKLTSIQESRFVFVDLSRHHTTIPWNACGG